MWILAAVLMLCPTAAQAQIWWDFVESLSGPGPFKGGGPYWRIACAGAERWRQEWDVDWTCFNDADPKIKQVVEVRSLFTWTVKDRPVLVVEPDRKFGIRLIKIDGVAAFRVAPFLDVGAGGGFMRFNGLHLEDPVWRSTIIPFSATYVPLATFTSTNPWRRLIRIRMETTYIPFGFTGDSWNSGIDEDKYSTDGNWVLSGGILFDLGSFICNCR
jgi:hypothetical protein